MSSTNKFNSLDQKLVKLNFDIYTLFEEMFDYLKYSILHRSATNNLWSYNIVNLRTKSKELNMYALDDKPYGGGHGMVLAPCIFDHYNLDKYDHKFYMSPRGKTWNQAMAHNLVKTEANIMILCGRYEGVDQRILDYYNFIEISIGDYILCGGEIPAMTIIESTVRLIPGVIKQDSAHYESFNDVGLLEYDLYTKPQIWKELEVPKELYSGHHKNINKWKNSNSLDNTYNKRHDLYFLYIAKIMICYIISY